MRRRQNAEALLYASTRFPGVTAASIVQFCKPRRRLFVIDGSKALRAAINAVFGSASLVQSVNAK